MNSAVLASIGVQNISTCLVSHCPNAFGVAINVDEQHKITYSGDTIPCDELVKIGEYVAIYYNSDIIQNRMT
jgi:ribonuclease Z